MAGEWICAAVGDAFDLVTGFAFKSADFVESGVPVIKIKNVKAGEFSEHEFSYVSGTFLRARSSKLARFGDLLISMSGNRHDGSPETWVGKVAQFRKSGDYFINQRVGALRVKPGAPVDPRFMSYLLASHPYQELFIAIATSSGGQANLSPGQILGAPIRYPGVDVQSTIADILGTLDDKIELSRRMTKTLEAMARALFNSWFVDFDPVRAESASRDAGLPQPLARLFPDSFEDSELGEIPRGWRVRNVSSIIDFVRGVEPGRSACNEVGRGLPFVRVGDVTGKRSAVLFTDSVLEPRCQLGDVLLALDGTPGAVSVGLHGVFSSGVRKLVPRPETYLPQPYVWSLALSDRFQETVRTHARGTTIQHAGGAVDYLLDVDPGPGIMGEYSTLTAPMWARLLGLHRETETLAGLRDTLLPKLISGELRLDAAKEMVARADA